MQASLTHTHTHSAHSITPLTPHTPLAPLTEREQRARIGEVVDCCECWYIHWNRCVLLSLLLMVQWSNHLLKERLPKRGETINCSDKSGIVPSTWQDEIVFLASCILHLASCILHLASCILHLASCILLIDLTWCDPIDESNRWCDPIDESNK